MVVQHNVEYIRKEVVKEIEQVVEKEVIIEKEVLTPKKMEELKKQVIQEIMDGKHTSRKAAAKKVANDTVEELSTTQESLF